ncbi:hypothetical protein GN956_G26999 [Arapaima gigas]
MSSGMLNISSVLSGTISRSVFSGPVKAEERQMNCNATNKHGTKLHPLPVAEFVHEPWKIGLGVFGGIIFVVGLVFFWRKQTKGRPLFSDPSARLASLWLASLLGNTEMAQPAGRVDNVPASMYEVEYCPKHLVNV